MNEHQEQKPMRWGARLREENRRLREKIEALKTEQRRRDKVIQYRDKLFHELPEPALLVQNDKIILSNEAVSRLLGFTADELAVTGLYDMIHPGSRAHLAATHKALAVGDPPQCLYEASLKDRAGGEIVCDIHLKKFRYEQGRITLLMHIYDLTERRKWERDRCETLKREAVERMGTELMKTLSACSHALKTGMGETPFPGSGEARAPAASSIPMTDEATECTRMSRDLAILTRTTYAPSDIVPLDMEALVNQAVREAEEMSAAESPEAGVRIKPYLRALPALHGHSADIQLALAHILRNAVEASPEGGTVYLTTETSAGMGLMVIQDGGQGIADSLSGQIFDPFFTTRPKTHRGLGLSLTRSIIEAHRGNITISTREGAGTMVTVQLPIENPHRSRRQAKKKKKISDAHILFTGEDGTMARLICRMLEDKGALISVASSIKEGIEVLGHREVDLIIADGKTPGIEKIRFIDRVKRQKPDLPVLLLNPNTASDGRGGGARETAPDRVMAKPILIDRLVRVSATLLSGEGA